MTGAFMLQGTTAGIASSPITFHMLASAVVCADAMEALKHHAAMHRQHVAMLHISIKTSCC
jgi:hypothetical protein